MPPPHRIPLAARSLYRAVFDDPWPEEPDDPFEDPGDAETQFDLTIPDDRAVPSGLQRAFWGLVAVFNVALFAIAVGAMLVGFRGQWDFGGTVLITGVVLFGYGVYKYRRFRTAGFRFDSATD